MTSLTLRVKTRAVKCECAKPGVHFYHPNPERFAEIAQRFFPYVSYRFTSARREIPIPALLSYTGYPLAENQYCFKHKGDTATVFSIFMHRDGYWYFNCRNPQCGIKGDVVQMWFQMVSESGLAPVGWDMPRACGDLLARAESGMIDTGVTELSRARGGGGGAKDPPPEIPGSNGLGT